MTHSVIRCNHNRKVLRHISVGSKKNRYVWICICGWLEILPEDYEPDEWMVERMMNEIALAIKRWG